MVRWPADEHGLFGGHVHLAATLPASRVPLHDLLERATAFRQDVIDGDWRSVGERALRCMGLGHASFQLLAETATVAREHEGAGRRQAAYFTDLLLAAAGGDGGDALRESLREKLAGSDPSVRLESALSRVEHRLGRELDASLKSRIRSASRSVEERIDLDASIALLADGRTDDVPLLEPFSPQPSAMLEGGMEKQADWVLACLTRGLLARVHAEFNLSLRSDRAPAPGSDPDAIRRTVERTVVDAERWLAGGQTGIYGALVGGEGAENVSRAAVELAAKIERRLPILARSQGAIRQTMLSLRARGKGAASERIGRLAARAGMLTREAIASHCASYRLALGALSARPPKDIHDLMRKAGATAFDAPLPNGRDVALKDLDASLDGEFVEIEGFVQALEALRLGDGKLVSRLVLHDPSSEVTANAVAIFAHLPHAGVTRDSFVRANGVFHAGSSLFDGEPAVEIDALSLAALGRSSWRIAFLELADRWFEPWRNGANATWSLGPHGMGDDGEGRFGAGELFFLPLIRR